MKNLVKRVFSIFGLGIYRLQEGQNGHCRQPPRLVISSPLDHNSKERLNAFYADQETAESYLDVEFFERLVTFVHDRGTTFDGKQVADLGCGAGHLLKFIQDKYHPAGLTGFEYSEAALAIARSRLPNTQMSYFDIYEPSSLTFDVVFCVEVLEHLLYPEKALRNVVRMIAPGGSALLTVPNGRTDTFEGHINFWSPESWDVFVRDVCGGFEVETGMIENEIINFAIIKSKSN
jgi:2-polyprenyl-3-methyl-5-hydroxy-6-metoxy-1,4-benzoquinol methylase